MEMRRGEARDAAAMTAVFRAARGAMAYLPVLHSADEDAAWIAGHVLGTLQVWVAGDGAIGWMALSPERIEHLYVGPALQGRGAGARLVAVAQATYPRLDLWTFQANAGARRFYARHGFVDVELTDGQGNEERVPDVRMEWRRA